MAQFIFETDPVADSDAIIVGPNYRFTVINDFVLRYEWAEDNVFEDRASTFAINRRFPRKTKPLIKETEHRLEIVTPTIHVSYDKKRFSPHGLTIEVTHRTTMWETTWRFGTEPGFNLGGTARTLDGVDGRCDMGSGVLSRAGFSVIDDSNSMLFDGAGFVAPRRLGDRVDGYLFSFGSDFKGAMKAFFDISGRTPRLPRWSLGNWWSRFHKYTADSYIDLMDKFRDKGIPLSVAVMDMDWHLVDGDEVPHSGWTGYTWNKELFPDPKAFADALHQRNLKMTLNDHPHVGIAHHEEQYEEMASFLGHDTSEKTPILFDPTDPKFIEAFFNILHRSLEKKGCDFWWIDWQQGPYSNVPGLDPLWLLNHFQFLDQEQTDGENRALIFSRFAGPGSHRYPIGFSGDSIVTWDSLRFQPEFTATASNIGYGWWSHDIGGHMHGCRDHELVARWVQLGVFSPIMRLHSCDTPWGSKEPWNYRPAAEGVITSFMQLRHRMIPYLYTLNTKFAEDDEPLVQPLYWKFPTRKEAFTYPNQYFFGPSLIAAPIVDPANPKTLHASVKVWLPPTAARYIDILTGIVYDSDREIQLWRTLKNMPVLAPEGSIIPLDAAQVPMNGGKNPTSFEVLVAVGQDGMFTIIEDPQDDCAGDNGGGLERSINIEWSQASGQLTIDKPGGRDWKFRFMGVIESESVSGVKVLIGDSETDQARVDLSTQDHLSGGLLVQVPVSAVSAGDSKLTIRFDQTPRLSLVDFTERFRDLLLDFQIEFALKDRIFAILTSHKPVAVKVGELLNVTCEEAVKGPLLELLVADSRTI
ncbi:glycosyl hydrolase family 31 [Colletotrichum camelliae]|nr:glycosyl hydrolase family 31 [Colletotrichum camelliae]